MTLDVEAPVGVADPEPSLITTGTATSHIGVELLVCVNPPVDLDEIELVIHYARRFGATHLLTAYDQDWTIGVPDASE